MKGAAASLATAVPSKKRGFCVPHRERLSGLRLGRGVEVDPVLLLRDVAVDVVVGRHPAGEEVPLERPAVAPVEPSSPGQPDTDPYYLHWDRLLKLIDRQDLIGDKRYVTLADRVEREAEVDEIISVWTRKHTKLLAMKMLGEAGLPAGAVLDTDELNTDVTFDQRGVMQTMVHPVHRPFKMPGWPVRVDGKASRITSSPMLGEHTNQVMSDWLGLTAQAVAEMKREGVI